MKVKLSKIVPNPYRDAEKYPVDRDRVLRHKKRIEETGFWDNIVGRVKPGTEDVYELAYGLHRLEALHELGYEEIDLIIKDFDDITMLKVMVRENEEDMQTRSVKHINESVEKAKEMIESAINGVNGVWEDLPEWCSELFENKAYFDRQIISRDAGSETSIVGRPITSTFLGDEWSDQTIKQALQALAESISVRERDEDGEEVSIPVTISREALELFETPKHAETATNLFKSPIGRAAFPDKESQKVVIQKVLTKVKPEDKLTSSTIKALLQIEAQKITGDEFPYEQRLPPISNEELNEITNDATHVEVLRRVFDSNEGKIAFNDQRSKLATYRDVTKEIRDEHKVLGVESDVITPEMVERKMKSKAYAILADSTAFAPDETLSAEVKTSLGKNRSYFTKSRANFKVYTKSPYDIPLYKDWIAEKDYYLLVADMGQRVKLLKEYESYLGVTPILDKAVYSFYDRVDDEYNKLEDLWKDVEYDTEPEITIEEWLESEEMYDDIMERLKSARVY